MGLLYSSASPAKKHTIGILFVVIGSYTASKAIEQYVAERDYSITHSVQSVPIPTKQPVSTKEPEFIKA